MAPLSTPPDDDADERDQDASAAERSREAPLVHVGTLAFAGAAAALTASVLPASRLAERVGGSPLLLVPMLAGAALPLAVLGVALARSARDGLRALTRHGAAEPKPFLAPWLGAVGVLAPVATVFGTALFATTHHRGLAGATFAVAFALAVVGVGLVARRVAGPLAAVAPSLRRVVTIASIVLFAVGLLIAARLFGGLPPSPVTACVQDACILAVAVALATSHELRARPFAYAGPPIALALLVASLVGTARTPVATDRAAAAPLFPPLRS